MENGTQMTLLKLHPKTFQMPSVSVGDSLVRLSALAEDDWDLRIQEELSSLRLPDWLQGKDLKYYSLKMSKGYCLTTKVKPLKQSFAHSTNYGMMLNGNLLTARVSEYRHPYHKTENGYVIGHIRGRSRREVFPIFGADTENTIRQIGRCKSEVRDNP